MKLSNVFRGGLIAFAMSCALPAIVFAVETNEPIKIAEIDSADADFIGHVYGAILKKVGYNVKFVRIDYTAQIPALETGDIDLTTSLWDTTSYAGIQEGAQAGKVSNYGSTGVEVKESWWYPKYLEESCPGLPSWTALKDPGCIKALATAETAPKARFVDAPADWETDIAVRMKALGLNFEVINSGSPIAMVAAIRSAVKRKEPVIGWGYTPHWFFNKTPGGFIELPAAEDACFNDPKWGVNPKETMDCGYSSGFVWKAANPGLVKKAPQAARILHLLRLPTNDVADATDRIENKGEKIEAVAADWLEKNAALWSGWK